MSPKIGTSIKTLREAQGLSVAELARRSGVGRTTLYRIESGAEPTVRTVRRIATALGLPIESMLGGTGALSCGQ